MARATADTAPRRSRKQKAEPLPREGVDDALAVINGPDDPIPPVLDDQDNPIPAELQFSTDDDDGDEGNKTGDDGLVELKVDNDTVIAFRPTKEQWGALMGMMSRASTVADRIHALQLFASNVLDEASYLYVERRLMDRTDKFGQKTFTKVLNGIIDHYSPDLSREERRQLARDMRR